MAGPKGNDRLPTIDFQGRTVSFREGSFFQGFSDGNSSIHNFSWENQMKVIPSEFENSSPQNFLEKSVWGVCVCVCPIFWWQPFVFAGHFGSLTPAAAKPGDKCKDSNTARNREARAQPTNSMVRCRDWLRKDLLLDAGVIYGYYTLQYFNGWFTYKSSHEKKGKWIKNKTSRKLCSMLIFRGVSLAREQQPRGLKSRMKSG